MWRGSLLPLGCEAAPNPYTAVYSGVLPTPVATTASPSGSKLPRHRAGVSTQSPYSPHIPSTPHHQTPPIQTGRVP
ncbi:hypothetical protein DCO47_21995 [Pseudomonas sp. NDM]|nr:hypothetical protein DCO47_21995 [Pseudomonas sp. NDM]